MLEVAIVVISAWGSVAALADRPPSAPSLGDRATQTIRDQRFRGMKRVLIAAQYGPGGLVADGESSAGLCREVEARARRGSPVPVDCVAANQAVPSDSAALTLIVQASVTRLPGGRDRLFAVSARREFDGGLEPTRSAFGAAPAVAIFTDTTAGVAARATAIDAVLDAILPWRGASGAGMTLPRGE